MSVRFHVLSFFAFLGTAMCAPLTEKPDLTDTTVAPQWIDEEIPFSELDRRERVRSIEEIIEFSKLQLDKNNEWIIDGVRGSGLMPAKHYRRYIENALAEPPKLVAFKKQFRPRDRIFHFVSPSHDEGYIMARGKRVISVFWVAIH